jgi:hypothetical protein
MTIDQAKEYGAGVQRDKRHANHVMARQKTTRFSYRLRTEAKDAEERGKLQAAFNAGYSEDFDDSIQAEMHDRKLTGR